MMIMNSLVGNNSELPDIWLDKPRKRKSYSVQWRHEPRASEIRYMSSTSPLGFIQPCAESLDTKGGGIQWTWRCRLWEGSGWHSPVYIGTVWERSRRSGEVTTSGQTTLRATVA